MNSLRTRLLVLLLGVLTLVWALALAAAWFQAHHELDELFDQQLEQTASTLLELDLEDLPGNTPRGVEDDDDGERSDATGLPDHLEYQVWRQDGTLLLRSARAPALPFDAAYGHHAFDVDATHWQTYARWNGDHDLQVRVFDREGHRRELTAEIIGRAALPLSLALPLLAALIWVAVGRALAPLDALSRAVAARDAGHLTPLPAAQVPAEARPLIDSLNALLERLAHSLQAEKRFTADAAHELRTPLAAIRAQAQVALASTEATGRNHALQGIIEGADRATRLAVQLLTLARAERDAPLPDTPVDLGEVARGSVARRAEAALSRHQTLSLNRSGPCQVSGDADLLDALCGNLIDNAIAYVPEGGRIEVEVSSPAGRVELRVLDDGPGVTPDLHERLTHRFFRAAPRNEEQTSTSAQSSSAHSISARSDSVHFKSAQSNSTHQAGSGLGLSIVREIAQRHRTTLTLSTGLEGKGFGVVVDFPALRS